MLLLDTASSRATIPTRAHRRPTARGKPVYRSALTVILTATAQLLAESFRLLPLVGCRTRHPLGCWVCCVQCHCKYLVACCCLCAPSFLIWAWDRQWQSFCLCHIPVLGESCTTSLKHFAIFPPHQKKKKRPKTTSKGVCFMLSCMHVL